MWTEKRGEDGAEKEKRSSDGRFYDFRPELKSFDCVRQRLVLAKIIDHMNIQCSPFLLINLRTESPEFSWNFFLRKNSFVDGILHKLIFVVFR